MSEKRMGRIEEEIKRIVSNIIAYEVKNPNIKGIISVTSVSVSNDLKYANIYISVFDKKQDADTLSSNVIITLNKSKGFIRKELASKIKLRYTPELIFKIDNSLIYGSHIDELLNKINIQNNDQ